MTADRDKDVEKAVELYEESLKYFLPLLHYETDLRRREKLRSTVSGYQRRWRELKTRNSNSPSLGPGLSTSESLTSLLALCHTNPGLVTGLEICISGDDYLKGGELNLGLDKITTGLGVLVPALQQEPRGARRDLLRKEVEFI